MSLVTQPELVLAQGIDWRMPITIDFETYYDKEWTLKKITTEKYIRGEKFECIGLSIKIGSMTTHFHRRENWKGFIQSIMEKYPNSPFVCHNASFDMGILGLRYGIHPRFTVDTSVMAKLCGLDRVAGGSSLAKLTEFLCSKGILTTVKGNEVHNMQGVHADDMTEQQWRAYAEYCKLDTDLCYQLYMYMLDLVPLSELVMSHITTEMWTKPVVQLNVPLLESYADRLAVEREQILKGIAGKLGLSTDDMLKHLRSAPKFKAILESLGVKVPMKHSEKQNKLVPALSKTDQEFLALQDHPNKLVSTLVSTKLGAMSSMEQTRTATFLDIAQRGLMPIPLRYAAAHTGRYGGCFVAETMVCLKSKNPFDNSPYYANIVDATPDTLIWNGEEFVEHDGVICNGVQEVINYAGLCGTRGHKVFTEDGLVTLEYARDNGLPIIDCALPSSSSIFPIAGTRPKMNYADGAVVPVYDILNAGKDHKYMANGKLVHNSDKVNLQNLSKRTKEPVLRQSLCVVHNHAWVTADSSQIECRVLSYLAKQDDVVDIFKSGKDVYLDMASKIYGESYESLYEQAKGENATKEGKLKRNIGKVVVLGAGYGAGSAKFADLMVQSGLADQADQAERLIATYRSANYMVKNFWDICQQALETMAQGGTMRFGGPDDNLFEASGATKFHGVTIPSIKLPNGTYIFYQNLRQEVDDKGKLNYVYDQWKGRGFEPKRIWGSALAENLCQALSFAILKWQAMCIQADGYQINLNIHDEWAGVYSRDNLKNAILSYHRHMSRVPPFLPKADGLLECEVDVGTNYAEFTTIPNSAFEETRND